MKKRTNALLALLLTAALAGCGNADTQPTDHETTEATPETTEAAPETTGFHSVLTPIEDYVGLWYSGESIQPNIRITSVNSEYLIFISEYNANHRLRGMAVLRDGRYCFGYDDLGEWNHNGGSKGEIILEEDGVTVTYHSLYDGKEAELTQHFTVKDEPDIIDLQQSGIAENISSDISDIMNRLTENGWDDFEIIDHEPNIKYRWGEISSSPKEISESMPPLELPENGVLYCVTAHHEYEYDSIYAVVYSVYIDGVRSEELSETYYISTRSHYYRGDILKHIVAEEKGDVPYDILSCENRQIKFLVN